MSELDRILSAGDHLVKFNEGLKSCTSGLLTIDKTLQELADFLFPQNAFDVEYSQCKINASSWIDALKLFITENYSFTQNDRYAKKGFMLALSNINPGLYTFSPDFVSLDKHYKLQTDFNLLSSYMSLSRGYRFALNYNKLNKEVEVLEAKSIERLEKKLVVKCNPAHFAAIIEMLMLRDYIQNPKNKEGTARILLRAFEFRDYPNVSVESFGKKFFNETPPINESDFEAILKGQIEYRKYLKGTKDV